MTDLASNMLDEIRKRRPAGPRRILFNIDWTQYAERLEGALLARMAGCTLGAIVEGWPIERMEAWARKIGDPFPPVDYWTAADQPDYLRYGVSRHNEYTRSGLRAVPVDDDIAYTLLGLLIAERYGPQFTTADVAAAWLRYLPVACTAEKVALENLRRGIPPESAAEIANPYREWIGASIRADPWGYIAPGWPERAAEMAFHDAFLTHRRNGIFGEMFFAAAIAAAFAVSDPIEAIRIGLTEIPKGCRLAREIRWALKSGTHLKDYRDARRAVDERFSRMHPVHTVNNACLTIFGLMLGGKDLTRVLSQTVAMGLDNDCTAATAGSILGAVVGRQGVPEHWHRPFNNTVLSYLKSKRRFTIRGLVLRFTRQARRVFCQLSHG